MRIMEYFGHGCGLDQIDTNIWTHPGRLIGTHTHIHTNAHLINVSSSNPQINHDSFDYVMSDRTC